MGNLKNGVKEKPMPGVNLMPAIEEFRMKKLSLWMSLIYMYGHGLKKSAGYLLSMISPADIILSGIRHAISFN